ncbi:kanadaptin [Colias croceus]|uniref:kanadaptin n=1 Tax=Colias crocea TaxID=72248 RepID=UPI001E279EE0|nr:kanadaptin [Colias croceus]
MENSSNEDSKHSDKIEFKKPVLFGRIGKLPKKVKPESQNVQVSNEENEQTRSDFEAEKSKSPLPPALIFKELSTPIPYKEPKWSGLAPDGTEYGLEVLKSGMIVEKVDLTQKAYFVFGRLANCDVMLAHPTISRHHAVLQYKAFAEENEPTSGWYLYDLGSTHGTFLNRDKLKPQTYTRVRVGHQIKFGTSTRTYIMLGPDYDCEGESELTVTEIKRRAQQMKEERDRMIQEAKEQREKERVEEEKRREEQGIDWGMGEDADEETDLADNPYAVTANEELYLDDPKKTLRGYFEREGHELNYDCEERGVGQFICRVELPLDDPHGRPIMAEVIHKGKKKEAVVACALEACRILDRAGVLRQAKHESRRRKQRDWSADDYYDSDEDTFLDRTGSVEKKRRQRMEKHGVVQGGSEKALTYEELLQQITDIEANIQTEEQQLDRLRRTDKQTNSDSADVDALDEYMNSLGKQSMAQKAEISKARMSIQKLKLQLNKTHRLADLARPAHAPPLIKKDNKIVKQNNSVVYGKRLKLKEDIEKKTKVREEKKQEDTEFVEEMDSDDDSETQKKPKEELTERISQKIDKPQEELTERISEKSKEDSISIESKSENESSVSENKDIKKEESKRETRVFGPMRPPENYVIPESYFDQESDRDLPEIKEKE